MLFAALPQLGAIDRGLWRTPPRERCCMDLGQDSSEAAEHTFYWFNIAGGCITSIRGVLCSLISM